MSLLSLLLASMAAVACPGRPLPSPQLAERLKDPVEVFGLVHWGPNTYTERQWGAGDEDPAVVQAPEFDAEQIVRACRDGGLQGLVIVAKHHDGMCLWPTTTTDHRIGWDYLRLMVDACDRYGLKHGFYVSPWDRHDAEYGRPEYVDTYWRQVMEVCGGAYGDIWELWLDSANGGSGWYGGAREVRSIADGYYRIDELVEKVRECQRGVCVFFDRTPGDFHFPANEKGEMDENARATFRNQGEPETPGWPDGPKMGDLNGKHFSQIECDFPLRADWFYDAAHDGYTKSPAYLMKIYLRTVGNGGTMNLGIAPNKAGRLSDEDVAALKGFAAFRERYFADRVQAGIFAAGGSSVRLEKPFNVIVMKEDLSRGEQIDGWELRAVSAEGKRRVLAKGKSIGIKRIRTLKEDVSAAELELAVTASAGEPQPVAFELYRTDAALIEEIAASTVAEMTDFKLVCENPGLWQLDMKRSVDREGTEYADIELSSPVESVPPRFSIEFAVPKYDMRYWWRYRNDSLCIPPEGEGGFVSGGEIPPVYELMDAAGRNRLTVAFSEIHEPIVHSVGIRSPNARVAVKADFFRNGGEKRKRYSVKMRLDHRDLGWGETIVDAVRWSGTGRGEPVAPPDSDYEPRYSLCYSWPLEKSETAIADEMERARRLLGISLLDRGETSAILIEGCQGDAAECRRRIVDARMVAGGRAVMGNPIEWQSYESPECAAVNFIGSLFGTLRLSMRLQHLSGAFPAMARHWIDFQRKYRGALLEGNLEASAPQAGYATLTGTSESCRIIAAYLPSCLVDAGALDRETVLIDGTGTGKMLLRLPRSAEAEIYDTFGTRQENRSLPKGIIAVELPASGYLKVK